jgi:hypothetical protein
VLVYGPAGSGKRLLCAAAACASGAAVFDLSPTTTDGKFPGKDVALMVQLVSVKRTYFTAGRHLAPPDADRQAQLGMP